MLQHLTSWRREPIGAGLSILEFRKKRGVGLIQNPGIFNLSPDEYADMLRAERMSERAIEKELVEFRILANERVDRRKHMRSIRESRRTRPVEQENLSPYVEAEIRRQTGIVADEVFSDFGDVKGKGI